MMWEGCFAVISEQRDGGAVMLEMFVAVGGQVRRGPVEAVDVETRKVIIAREIM